MMYSKHLFLYAFKPPKDKCYVDVKLNLLLENVQRYTLPKLAENHYFCDATRAFFFGGGGGGWSDLRNNEVNQQKNVPMVTSWVRPVCNINMAEIGRPPSSDIFLILPGLLSQRLLKILPTNKSSNIVNIAFFSVWIFSFVCFCF